LQQTLEHRSRASPVMLVNDDYCLFLRCHRKVAPGEEVSVRGRAEHGFTALRIEISRHHGRTTMVWTNLLIDGEHAEQDCVIKAGALIEVKAENRGTLPASFEVMLAGPLIY
jgi:hypothetical protein